MRYIVVTSDCITTLQHEVNEYLSEGWMVVGGVSMSSAIDPNYRMFKSYAQAMQKIENTHDEL